MKGQLYSFAYISATDSMIISRLTGCASRIRSRTAASLFIFEASSEPSVLWLLVLLLPVLFSRLEIELMLLLCEDERSREEISSLLPIRLWIEFFKRLAIGTLAVRVN